MRHVIRIFVFSVLFCWAFCAVSFADTFSVRRDIFEALDKDPAIGAYEIEIDARFGNVIVFGKVGSEEARIRVEEIARHTKGVRSVENNLVVSAGLSKSNAASAARLAQTVREAILAHADLGTYDLEVSSLDGAITLNGSVANERDRSAVLKAAQGVTGVESVKDELRLRAAPSDDQITGAVLAALRKEPSIEVEELSITTHQGVVRVEGKQADHRKRDLILSIVINVPGVHDIQSHFD